MSQGPNYSASVGLDIQQFLNATKQMQQAWMQAQQGIRRGTKIATATNAAFTTAMVTQAQVMAQHNSKQVLQQRQHNYRMQQIQQQHYNRMTQMAVRAAQVAQNLANKAKAHRGAMMPHHSQQTAQNLLKLASAAQGAMLATSLLQGNIQGLLFGLVFLSWAELRVALTTAALTVAFGTLIKVSKTLIGLATSVGKEWEAAGVRMAHGLNSAARSIDVLRKSATYSMAFGLDPKQTQESIYQLEKLGLASDAYIKGLANAAAGTGGDLADITKRFVEITKSDAEERSELVKQFSKDFEIEVKNYASSIDLITALNDRWNGSVEDMANTQGGIINRIKATWYSFGVSVGIVLNEYIKPVLRGVLAMVEGLRKGFDSAMQESIATGEMAKNAANFSQIMTALIPKLFTFGFVLGKVIFKAIQLAAKMVKTLSDALIRLWNKIKPIIDTIRQWIPKIKELIDKLVEWYRKNKDLIDAIVGIYLAMIAFNKLAPASVTAFGNIARAVWGLVAALWQIPQRTISIMLSGVEETILAILKIKDALDQLRNKILDILAYGIWDLLGALERLGGAMGTAADKIKEAARQIIDDLARIIDKVISIGNVDPTEGARRNWPLKFENFIPAIAQLMAGLFTNPAVVAALSNPIVAGVIVGAIILGLAYAFPFEAGQIAAILANAIVIAVLGLPILLTRATVMLSGFLIYMFEEAVGAAIDSIKAVFGGIFTAVMETARSVFTGTGQLIGAIIRGDWSRAASEGLSILLTLFFRFPVDVASALLNGLQTIVTDIIPEFFRSMRIGFTTHFGPIIDVVRSTMDFIGGLFGEKFAEFARGVRDVGLRPVREILGGQLNGLWDDFKRFFSMTGINSIGKMVVGIWDDVRKGFEYMANPFTRLLGWLDGIISRIRNVIDWYNRIPLVPSISGGSSSGGGSSGSSDSGGTSSTPQYIPAYVIGKQSLAGGAWNWVIQRSRYVPGTDPGIVNVTTPNDQQPDLSNYVFGGRVPGVPGEKRLVVAEAGEMFGGHPTFAEGRPGRGGGTTLIINNDLRGSVVTNDLVKTIAEETASEINRRMFGNRRMMIHRLGG